MISVFVRNPVFCNLTAIAILGAGVVAVQRLPLETFPETAVDHILIETLYPGASPADVELAICVKIEKAIQGIPGIWEISSQSSENVGLVVAAVDERIALTSDVLRQVRDRVNAITTFPPEAEKPVATEVIIRNHVISIGVHGDAPEQTIKQVAEDIQRDLMAHPRISQVSLSGIRASEISIKLTENTLTRYGLTLQQVMNAVTTSSLDLPAGTVRTANEEITVRTMGQRYFAQAFEDLVVIATEDGTSIRLGQIAEVRDTFEETTASGRIDGEPGGMIAVSKTGTEDLSEIARIVREYVKAIQALLPEGIEVSIWADASRDVDGRIAMLVKNGIMGMILVLVCLLLFMDLHFALAVALGIPVSFAGALITLGLAGGTLNMISLLGLLMVTGVIVDDAIVIADSVWAQTRKGLAPELAAIKGTEHVALPVLVASVTTIITFIPLMHVEGVMGKLIYVLPVVVIAAVVSSAFEAFVILPTHLREWSAITESSHPPSKRERIREYLDRRIDGFITGWYRPMVRRALRRRIVVLGGSAAMFMICAGLVIGGRTPFVLFPALDTNMVRVRLEFRDGSPIEVSRAAVAQMEAAALALNIDPELKPATRGKLVQQIYSDIGEWPDYVPKRASSLCETSIELMSAELRRVDVAKIVDHWRRGIGTIPDVVSMSITRAQLGPTEKPIEVRLLGNDLEELRQAANAVRTKLESYENVFDIHDELSSGKRELKVFLKPSARNLGLTVGDLASQLRQGLYGGEALRLQRGTDEIRVVVRYADSERRSLAAIENLRIRARNGAEIPFHEVAETKLVRGYSAITRQDGMRRCRIRADIDERFANAEQIVSDMASSFLPKLQEQYPGVRYLIDGQRKRINESLSSLLRGAAIAGMVMFAILGAVLKSYTQPLVVMAAIPLGLIGAVLGHWILRYDLTLMSAFGVVALTGIVVNDALVLIDQVNRNIAAGMGVAEAVANAGETRFRAVVLTTVTTVCGLLPLLAERSSQAQPLIPLAISIAFGELFGTVLTLFVVPALILVLDDLRRIAHWLRYGGTFPASDTFGATSTVGDRTASAAPTDESE